MNFSLVIIEMLRIKDLPTHFRELLTKIKVFNVETISPGNTPARLRESSLKQQFSGPGASKECYVPATELSAT